jgi:hypothetical protein
MVEISNIIEEKRGSVRKILRNLLNDGKISIEEYSYLLEKSELMGKQLMNIFAKGKMLIENGIIGDLSDLFKFEKKSQGIEQSFDVMKEIILSSLGSKNPYVQHVAFSIARERARDRGLPESAPISDIYSYIRVPVLREVVKEIHVMLLKIILTPRVINISNIIDYLERLNIDEKFLQSIILLYHAREVAEAIYNWVRKNLRYISEPGEWFKPALHTLIVGGGDCDCLAILLCSLWRSIGFKTYLGFLPGHVFPGVILSKPVIVNFGSLPSTERKNLRGEDEKFLHLQDEDFIIVNRDIRVPCEVISADYPSVKIGEFEVTLDNFTLAFMEDEELRALKEELKYEWAVKRVEEFLKLRNAKVFDISVSS